MTSFSQKHQIWGHEIFELFFGKILGQKFKKQTNHFNVSYIFFLTLGLHSQVGTIWQFSFLCGQLILLDSDALNYQEYCLYL